MSSFNATAQGRADIRNLHAGGSGINRIALSRSLLWLLARFLPLVIILAWQVNPAQAATIGNGEVVSGSVTGTGTQSWTFYAASGQTILGGINAPTPAPDFSPCVYLYNPDGSGLLGHCGGSSAYGYRTGSGTTQTGTFTIKGYNQWGSYYPSFTANFQMNLAVAGPVSFQTHGSGGTMYTGATVNGDLAYGNFDIWKLALNAGDSVAVVMTAGAGFTADPEMSLYSPSGAGLTGTAGPSPRTLGFCCAVSTGTYTLTAYNYPNSSIGPPATYTLKMTGSTALPTDAKTDGTCATCRQNALAAASNPVSADGRAAVGQPINIATGNMYEQVTDYTTIGTNKLAFIRSYNSYSQQHSLFPTALGPNWRSNYDRYLRSVSASLVTAERADGRVINFKLVSSVWTPDTDVDVKLTNSGSTYTLTDSDDTVETYTVASGVGTLNSIAYPNGYTQTLTYTSGKLTSVSDSYSRTLTLTYTGSDLTGVSTPDSATLTYGYTSTAGSDLLTSVTYNTSPSTSQTYVYANTGLPFALTSITDENGNTNSQWSYDGAGRCTMSENAGGANEVQVSYDDSTGNRTVTDPLGNAETYKFTTSQNMQKISEIDRAANSPVAAASRYFTYDTNGYLATATDWDGSSTHWTNNSHGLPTSVTEAYGAGVARTTTISYDSTWVHKPYTTTKTNVTIDDRYDATQGTLLTHTLTDTTGGSTNGQTHIWNYTYNATGELLTAQTPRTGTTVKNTYTWSSGALASITDQLSHTITINTANGTGQPTQITDPNSVVTNLVYNNRNWLTSKTVVASPSNEVTTITYEPSGQPDLITLPDSSTIDFDYDTAQRLTTVTNTAGETINFTLNAAGKATTTTIKDSGGTTRKSSTATYDVLADMLTRVGSAGATQTTTYAYDGNRNRTSVSDPNSAVWGQAYDALNRASTVTDPLTHTAAPTYNNLDQVTAQTDFNGYSTSYTRDAFGNAIAKSSPDTGSESFTYDEDNNLTARTDARSVASAQTFDAADRITAHTFTGYSGEAIAYTYDSTSGGNKGVGRLTSFSDESGSTTQKFDSFGNLIQTVRTIGANNYTTSYSYDLANRVTEIIYPSGRYVDYTFDSSGYLTTVTTKPTSGGSVTTLASSIVHKPFGPIASFTYGNSEALTKTFDNNYWLDDLVTTHSGTDIQNLTYGFDYVGNLTSITDNLAAGRDETYTVDSLNRLHTASGAYGSRTYTYDNNGNRLTRVYGGTTQTSTLTTSTNLLASITDGTNTRHFTNSASGNVLTDDRVMNGAVAISNTYGGRDRLEAMTVGTPTITFKINALGQRVQKAVTGATTDYQFDLAGHIIGESDDSTGNNLREYVYAEGMPLAQIDSSGNIFYIHNSQIGAPQKITDASRTIVWDYEIEPFGETYATPTNTDPTNIRFLGQYADAENLLSYNLFRDYDPTLGRYIEHDPLGLAAGMNLFAYANGNPTQIVDFFGLDSDEGGSEKDNDLLGNQEISDDLEVIQERLDKVEQDKADAAAKSDNCPCNKAEQSGQLPSADTLLPPSPAIQTLVPPLPGNMIGINPTDSAGSGQRVNTNLPAEDFTETVQKLTGGNLNDEEGDKVCPNKVRVRPPEGGKGPRIDIPANGIKPPETIHFPPETSWPWSK